MFADRMFLVRCSGIVALLALGVVPAHAQSLLERPPNISGNWTGAPGTLYFTFLHRFATSSPPERKVSNVPTFLLGTGLPKRLMLGLNYSTNSVLAPRFPNEWELFGRWLPLSQDNGAPVDLGGQVGYNNASDGVDGEVSVARRVGAVRLLAAGRALADPFERGKVRMAVGAGAAVRMNTYLALTGDVSALTNRDSSERVAWSAGLHVAIPLTPHTVSFQATNTLVTTLQGISRGSPDVRYGFEFTIPFSLRRYFGRRADVPVAAESPAQIAAADSARAELARQAAADSMRLQGTADSTRRLVAERDSLLREIAMRDSMLRATSESARQRIDSMSAARRVADSVRAQAVVDSTRAAAAAAARATPPRQTPQRTTQPRTVRTGMRNTAYINGRLEITVGTTVQWTNNDAMPHTVTAVDKSFDSGIIGAGRTWSHTFTKAGTYNFYCMPHPFMKGVIVVKQP